MELEFIDVQEKDFQLIKEIYDFYILNTTATFHTEKITIAELKESILVGHPKYPSLLIKYEDQICGFCYISQYKKRQAYDRTAEITIYLKPEYAGKGIGQLALKKMEDLAKQNGLHVLMGIISGDNQASILLFEKCGYRKCAHFQKVGEKFNKVLDVVAYQKLFDE
jgi:L-amino acid N-acyltransferase YncA